METFLEAKQQVVAICRELVTKGFLMGTGGNVSVRVTGQPAFAITPSNYEYTRMTPQDVCVLGWDLKPRAGERQPSIESGLHAAVYENRPDACAVIHTHQVYASTFALMNRPIPALFDEQARFLGRSVEVVSYAPSGTGLLKRGLVARLRNHCNAYILQNHGAVCLGDTPERALFNVELLEKCALTYLLALCTGSKVTRIPLAVREIAFSRLRKDQARYA